MNFFGKKRPLETTKITEFEYDGDFLSSLEESWKNIFKGKVFCFECWIINTWKKIKYTPRAIKYTFQRMIRGFGDDDLWDMFSTESKRTVKMLKEFKKQTYGYPNGMAWEEWMLIMDDMIYFHENVDSDIQEYPFYEAKGKVNKYREPVSKEQYDRYRRGRYYWYKHYQNLWS